MIKKFFIAALLCTVCMLTMAQSQTVTHVVQRGETLESIAEYYKVSVDDINKANPNVDGVVYVGMKLNIPTKTSNTLNTGIKNKQTNTNVPQTEEVFAKERDTTNRNNVKNQTSDLNDFSYYGANYRASFEDAGRGCYSIGGMFFSPSGWGGNFFIGANYGLAEKHYEGVYFYIGPSYGYAFNNILLMGSLDFMGGYTGQGEEEQNGTNHKGETYSYIGTTSKFGWGITLTPQIGIKLNKVTPYLGFDFMWSKDAKKINVGFCAGVGFHI